MGNVLDIEKFNEKFRLKVTDIVGDFFGEKTFYQFENWEEIQFFLPFGYTKGKRQIEITEVINDPETDQIIGRTKVKVFEIGEESFFDQVNNVLYLFGDKLVIPDESEKYGVVLIDLPSKFTEYTYVARRKIFEATYHTVLNSDDITFVAKEGSRAVFTKEEVESDPILRQYYFKELRKL